MNFLFSFLILASEKIFHLNTATDDHDCRVLSNRQKLIHRAKMKSLRISVAIIVAFIVCWTPYYVSMMIYMFLDESERVNEFILSCIFSFLSNCQKIQKKKSLFLNLIVEMKELSWMSDLKNIISIDFSSRKMKVMKKIRA